MKYAIIRINKTQYKVSEGDEILVDLLKQEKIEPEVLFLSDEDKIQIGQPLLPKVKIEIKKLENEKGEKIQVKTYKAKSRHRRHIGFRAKLTRLKIVKID